MKINHSESSDDMNRKKLWVCPKVQVLPIEQTNQLPPPEQPAAS